ncbi:hypothetical protein C8046_03515 [Serinibacter arcticus]|uniref:Uncharacterized protein n=2 Tax=Serinibacter arcticus TaxID=1655435 RepID=A0A2U1ZSC7_9MICO|nr:hypothetical protein C8046_03515 [Serinibacter arcticus]
MAFLLVAGVGGVLTAGLLMPAVAAVGSTSNAAQRLFDDLPTELEISPPSEQSQILASDGSLLATFYAENRVVVPLEEISQNLRNAVIATEDQRFYEHGGMDPEGLARAVVQTVGGNTQGASTLTQQYVKNVLLEQGLVAGDEEAINAATEADGAEGISRKLQEIKYAISLEKVYEKDQILEGYLNIAQFSISNYGAEAASQYYFGHSAAEMTPAEAALVAGVTRSPGVYDPTRGEDDGYETATNRRDTVLVQMRDQGYITPEEFDVAVATPVADMLAITPTPVGCSAAGVSAYFCEYVTNVLLNDGYLGATQTEARDALRRGGYTIRTTIDPVRQDQAFESLVAEIPENDPTYRSPNGEGRTEGISGAISTVEPGTGDIIAMVQNTTYGEATPENPRATRLNFNVDRAYGGGAGFQTGSTFKAFVLAQWLIEGRSLSEPINSANNQSFPAGTWDISCSPESVANYDPRNLEPGGGTMSVLQATMDSVNTSYVRMANQMDLCALRETTSAMGVHVGDGTIDPARLPATSGARSLYEAQAGADILAIPSMALGSNTIAPLTMNAAFATFAAGGIFCEPRAITGITDRDGVEVVVPEPECSRALEENIAAGVNHALQNVVQRGTATGARLDRPAAGKTGTANEDYHAWFIGYTPQLSTAVWMGHSEGDIPMVRTTLNGRYHAQIFGGRIPAPIWGDYMTKATEGMDVEGFPDAQERQIFGDRVAVPGVVGQSVNGATATLRNAGFRVIVGEGRYSATVRAGAVAQASPGSGARVAPGAAVTVHPSLGPEPAPPAEPEDTDEPGDVDEPGESEEPDGDDD